MAELGTPGGFVQFKGLTPKQAATNYTLIIQHLQQMGFHEFKTKSADSAWPLNSLFSGRPSGYFKDFIFDEKSNPYVISLQIDMNATHTGVNYQLGEYERVDGNRMRPRVRSAISIDGCQVVTTVNAYIVAQLGENHLVYNGFPKCSKSLSGT